MKPYLGLVCFWSRHDPAQNTHFLRHQRSLLLRQWFCSTLQLTVVVIRVLASPAPQLSVQVFEKVSVVLCSDEKGGEETEYEADTWTVQSISVERRGITDLLTPPGTSWIPF